MSTGSKRPRGVMAKRLRRFGTAILALSAAAAGYGVQTAGAGEVFIGTGSRSGVYIQVGRAICRLLNEQSDRHGLVCSAPPTAGSISNLESVRAGDLEFGVVQSDWHHFALSGTSRFADAGPDQKLRSLFSVHGEPFTLVARRDAGIAGLDDLEGKRVNIGNPGSGQRATMELVMAAKGWTKGSFSLANELPASQQSLALCHDRVQAMVYTVGHPNPSVRQATDLCDASIVNVKDATIDRLVAEYPFYSYVTIPGGLYTANAEPVTTFGVRATVVSSADVDADVVYEVVKAVFDDLEEFKRFHPAFSALTPEVMVKEGLSAPLHDGAARYFQEKGLL
jgi:TRAP transporter TAXI family solute receptor